MLRDLYIRNLAVVEEASIELGPGFNVLTGETGAGKSIVVDSLLLLSGARASTDLIRTGADALNVTGVFLPPRNGWRPLLSEAGIDHEEPELVVRREVARSGRNRVFVNDQPVTLKLLAALRPYLLRIHGQREELGMIDPELQRTWLDRCGGKSAEKLTAQTAAAFQEWQKLHERLQRLTGDDQARQERIDLLRFQLSELEAASPKAGEEDELRRDRDVLRNAEAIRDGLSTASSLLFEQENAAYDALVKARQALEEVADWEPQAAEWAAELQELDIRMAELEAPLARRLAGIEADPRRLDLVEDRLALLERLFRKHGASSAELIERRDALAAELDDLAGDTAALDELEAEMDQALKAFREASDELSAGRRKWSKKLEERLLKDLKDLALAKARFAIELETRARANSPLRVGGQAVEFNDHGYDQVVYTFSPNPGEDMRPLQRAASGGELSRLYLAVQLAARGARKTASTAPLVFDEVDTGVGGAEAAQIGKKLRSLAQGGQILAVTHLPQVASCADLHFRVKKNVAQGRTLTVLQPLEDQGRVEEIARMLAGSEITDLSLSHARELIKNGADI